MKNFFLLFRPHQYVKNVFIFLPLFFAGQALNPELVINAFISFVAFSISASAVYTLNDYKDIEEDRQHPKKKYRPLASGSVSTGEAKIAIVIFLIVGNSLMATISMQALAVLGVYIVLNIGYSFYFKHISLLDVNCIAIGFVLRLFIGSIVTGIPLSMWILIMTFLLALFLALAKRRDDVLLFLNTGEKVRKVIDGYNLQLIDGTMMIMASVVIVAYILYTTSTAVVQRMQTEYLFLTVIFVIFGIMRYLQLIYVENDSGSPTEIIVKDKFMQLAILAWIVSFVWIIYL